MPTVGFPRSHDIDLPWANVVYSNNSWVSNSYSYSEAVTDPGLLKTSYFVIALSFAILLHSFLINKKKFPIVRIATGRIFFDELLLFSKALNE